MHRAVRLATALVLMLAATATIIAAPRSGIRYGQAQEQERGPAITVTARLTAWVARRDGYFLYRDGATVRMISRAWPNLHGEQVRARLEWRRPGMRWRLLDVSSNRFNRDSRALFLVRGLPGGYSFRIRVRVPPGGDHGAGRSPWRYFRVG